MLRLGGVIAIGDIDGVVVDESLEFREEQVQCVRKKGNEEEQQQVLAALAMLGEVILDQRQLKLKENQDGDLITESEVFEINETNKIRELYRTLCEIPETEKEKDTKAKQEVAKEWEAMEEIHEVNSDGKLIN